MNDRPRRARSQVSQRNSTSTRTGSEHIRRSERNRQSDVRREPEKVNGYQRVRSLERDRQTEKANRPSRQKPPLRKQASPNKQTPKDALAKKKALQRKQQQHGKRPPKQTSRPVKTGNASGYQPYTNRRNNTAERFRPLIVAASVFLLIWFFGIFFFSSHFLPGTIINGRKVGGMNIAKAEKVITQDYDSHTLTIKEMERKESINPKDIDLEISEDQQISDVCKKQGKLFWIFKIFGKKKKTVNLDISYDAVKLQQIINGLKCFDDDMVEPANAYIKPGQAKFIIEPEVEGNTIRKETLTKAIKHAFATCKTKIDLDKDGLYERPSVYRGDERLKKALKTANKYAQTVLTYNIGYTTEVCDYNVFKDWVTVTGDFEVIYKDESLSDYVINLGTKYNTVGSTRDFTNFRGQQIQVGEGDYGWKIDYDQERAKLNADLKSGEKINREPLYSSIAQCRVSPTDDIGNSYVEVSIDEQMVYLFLDGKKIVSSPVVTGDTEKKYDTHKGVYGITYKQRNATLTGEDYSSPVSYWMPFNGNEGLHDAPWRSDFGGYIYQGGGSHGCVNCPVDVAAKLYQYVKKGFPVVVY